MSDAVSVLVDVPSDYDGYCIVTNHADKAEPPYIAVNLDDALDWCISLDNGRYVIEVWSEEIKNTPEGV